MKGYKVCGLEKSTDYNTDAFGDRNTDTYWHWGDTWLEPTQYPDVVSDTKKTTVFLVSVIYSTGDSFGTDHNSEIEHLGIFDSRMSAHRLVDLIDDWNSSPNGGPLKWTDDQGQEHVITYVPWQGYFERFGEAKVTKIEIEDN